MLIGAVDMHKWPKFENLFRPNAKDNKVGIS